MTRCNHPIPCTSSRPCPLHEPSAYRDKHGSADRETYAIDDETRKAAIGPLELDVDWLRKAGVPVEMLGALWTELSATYRKWEMRELPSPAYAAYHYANGWLINGGDRDSGPGGFFSHDVALAARFEDTDEIIEWIEARGLSHPEAPRNHQRAGFTILRVK